MEDLIEVRPSAGATTEVEWPTIDWARRWPDRGGTCCRRPSMSSSLARATGPPYLVIAVLLTFSPIVFFGVYLIALELLL